MFDEIGRKIKILAKCITIIGIIIFVIYGIIIFANYRLLGLAIMLGGSLLSWISSFMLYGFGHLIENTEILVNYEPKMHYFTEWWKQLYGESEGKDKKGIFPAGALFTTDLHSLGQYIQDGKRNLFETVIDIENPATDITIKKDADNIDGLNFVADKTMDYVNKKAMEGTIEAHVSGEVPNIKITIDKLDEETLGELIYFFELACGISGKILGVNPFNQPGVEAYKKNMFRLLGKE